MAVQPLCSQKLCKALGVEYGKTSMTLAQVSLQSSGCFSNFFTFHFIQQRLRVNDIVLKILDPESRRPWFQMTLDNLLTPMETHFVCLCKTKVHSTIGKTKDNNSSKGNTMPGTCTRSGKGVRKKRKNTGHLPLRGSEARRRCKTQ